MTHAFSWRLSVGHTIGFSMRNDDNVKMLEGYNTLFLPEGI
jgi:hypothetical protein